MQNRTKVEDVASLCAYLQEGNEPSFLSLKGTMLSMPTGSPAALERWSSTESWLKRQEVSQEAVESGLYSLTPLDGPGTICTISGGSHSLTNMQLCLTDENGKQAIVLDESCTDVKIQDSIFEGAQNNFFVCLNLLCSRFDTHEAVESTRPAVSELQNSTTRFYNFAFVAGNNGQCYQTVQQSL